MLLPSYGRNGVGSLLIVASIALLAIYSLSGSTSSLKTYSYTIPESVSAAVRSTNLQNIFTSKGSSSQNNPEKKRITLIAVWNDDYLASYLPSLFTSAIKQADAVDLLWINVKKSKDACLDVSSWTSNATNIHAYCITNFEKKIMIADYFCSKWNCTEEQRHQVVEKHLLNERWDGINVDFKPWRGQIYKKWVQTEWWAWLDPDQVIGDFNALWPWKTVDNFDMVTITESTVSQLYLRGQFTAFKLNDKLDNIWLEYGHLKTPEDLHTLPGGAPDEWQYSTLYMHTLKEVNWMMVGRALGADRFGKNKLVMHGKKAFYVPFDMPRSDIVLLFQEGFTPTSQPILAPVEDFDPQKYGVPLRELEKDKDDTLWGKPLGNDCNFSPSRCAVIRDSYFYKSIIMRYNGQLLEYFDRQASPRVFDYGYRNIEEKLLIHHHRNKKEKWFKLPMDGIQDNEILEMSAKYHVKFDINSLETTWLEHAADYVYKPTRMPNGMGYSGYKGVVDQLPEGLEEQIERAKPQ